MPPQTQTASTPVAHEHDSIAITNVDVDCNETTTYTIEQTIAMPPEPGVNNPLNIPIYRSQVIEGEFRHSEYFEVRYNILQKSCNGSSFIH